MNDLYRTDAASYLHKSCLSEKCEILMLSKFFSHWKDYPDFAILQAVTTGLVGKPHSRQFLLQRCILHRAFSHSHNLALCSVWRLKS